LSQHGITKAATIKAKATQMNKERKNWPFNQGKRGVSELQRGETRALPAVRSGLTLRKQDAVLLMTQQAMVAF
jgi:hypothetical protein